VIGKLHVSAVLSLEQNNIYTSKRRMGGPSQSRSGRFWEDKKYCHCQDLKYDCPHIDTYNRLVNVLVCVVAELCPPHHSLLSTAFWCFILIPEIRVSVLLNYAIELN